jgi:selenide, water dikinase
MLQGGTDADRLLLADPQTSGGLLVSCAPAALDGLLADLRANDRLAAVIGTVTSGDSGSITLI